MEKAKYLRRIKIIPIYLLVEAFQLRSPPLKKFYLS
jgi:hypothetical protein